VNLLDWGIEVVLWLQRFSPALDAPFKALTFLGDQEFFMLFLPLVYWCVDREAGRRLIVLFLLSAFLNSALKELFAQPRPFEYDHRVRRLVAAAGGGLPSGHTQGATVVWGYIGAHWRRPWLWALVAVLMTGIPLSRVYLGVHFPTDLLGGYAAGALVLISYYYLAPRIVGWLQATSLAALLILGGVLPLVLAVVFPLDAGNGLRIGASLAGMSVGFLLEQRFVRFETAGSVWRRLFRYMVGVAVLFGIYLGLRMLLSGVAPAAFWRLVRYGLVGFWGAFGAPWVFVKLRLAQTGP